MENNEELNFLFQSSDRNEMHIEHLKCSSVFMSTFLCFFRQMFLRVSSSRSSAGREKNKRRKKVFVIVLQIPVIYKFQTVI